MKNNILVFALFLISFGTLFGQFGVNIVPNSGFENGNNNRPNQHSQMNKSDFWREQVNTPDWYREGEGLFQSGIVEAHSGIGYMGFSPCEGAKVKLEEEIDHLNYVVISFWYSPESYTNTNILVSLTQENPATNDNYSCSEDGPLISPNFQLTIPVESDGGNAEHQIGQWYFYESEPILIDYEDSGRYEWLVISGKDEHENGGGEYVYVDDVSVIQFGGCEHVCSISNMPNRIISSQDIDTYLYNSDDENNLGGENQVRTYVPIGGSSDAPADEEMESDLVRIICLPNTEFRLNYLIENAVRIQFMVLNPLANGDLIYYQEVYDYNGLHDEYDGVIFPDYLFEYNGQNTQSGSTYSTLLYIEFCGGRDILIDAGVYVEYNDGTEPADVSGNDIQIAEIENCCDEYYEIQNVIYTFGNTYRYDANDYIRAGENITTTEAPGPVYVTWNADVTYYAGNNIFLEPGFSADGRFKAEIHACGNAPKSFDLTEGSSRRKMLKRYEEDTDKVESLNNVIKVYPNPTSHKLFLDSDEEIIGVKIYSLDGKLLFEDINVNNNRYSVDVDHLKGTFILKCQTLNSNFTKLIVVE